MTGGGPVLKTRGVSRRLNPAMQMGDPGLFGFLGGALKAVGKIAGFIPGIGGTIEKVANLAGGGLQSLEGAPKTTGQAARAGQTYNTVPTLSTGPGLNFPGQRPMSSPGSMMMPTLSTVGMPMPGPGQPGRMVQTSRNIGLTSIGGDRAPSGYHLNKTDYFLKSGQFVEAGTRWVRNRRTNPLNPRALSHSMRRMSGFARASKGMRQDAGRVATAIAGPKRSACGCKGKKR